MWASFKNYLLASTLVYVRRESLTMSSKSMPMAMMVRRHRRWQQQCSCTPPPTASPVLSTQCLTLLAHICPRARLSFPPPSSSQPFSHLLPNTVRIWQPGQWEAVKSSPCSKFDRTSLLGSHSSICDRLNLGRVLPLIRVHRLKERVQT